jgi:hypothetical protein
MIFFGVKINAGRQKAEDQALIYAVVLRMSGFDTLDVRNKFKIKARGTTFAPIRFKPEN